MITKDILAQALSAWLRIDPDQVSAASLEGLAPNGPFISSQEALLRRLVFGLLRRMDQTQQIRLTDALKRVRGSGAGVQDPLGLDLVLERMRRLKEEAIAAGLPVDCDPGAVCFSHDVDWIECQQFTPQLAALETQLGVKASYLFLTEWNYRLDHGLVQDLAAAGFDIGLHGTTHDIALGFRSRPKIIQTLERGRAELPVAVQGYRAPALANSALLLEVLAQLGFAYDSSLPVQSASFAGVGLCLPLVLDSGLVELPLTLQDSMLFRDRRMSDAQALSLTADLMRQVVELGGLFVFNGHPGILRHHMDFFNGLLAEAQQYRLLTMGQAAAWWQARQQGEPVV